MSRPATTAAEAWPELPWTAWGDSLTTLHMWTQIVGKVRLELAPPESHWWNIPLYVSARGLTTSPIPYRERLIELDFDFVADRLRLTESGGRQESVVLAPKTVAQFYGEVMEALRDLDVDVSIRTRPVEVVEAIPFEDDDVHASYDRDHVLAFWTGLLHAHRVLEKFRARFAGKVSPVQFFWGSFDLATTRFSGRRAPKHPGGSPNCPAWVMEEAYSHEVSSAGWWPLDPDLGPAFYAYMYPEPTGYRDAEVRPAAATYDARLGEFVLPCDAVRAADDPDALALRFLEDTYARGADLAAWPRSALESTAYPSEVPARGAWSTVTAPLWRG